jgi:hypothetical protein
MPAVGNSGRPPALGAGRDIGYLGNLMLGRVVEASVPSSLPARILARAETERT